MHLFRVQPISNLILRLPITEGSVDSNAYEIASAIVTRRLTSNEGEFIIDTRFGNIMSDTVDNQKCVNRFPVPFKTICLFPLHLTSQEFLY